MTDDWTPEAVAERLAVCEKASPCPWMCTGMADEFSTPWYSARGPSTKSREQAEADAEAMQAAFDPATGYAAALREVLRLRERLAEAESPNRKGTAPRPVKATRMLSCPCCYTDFTLTNGNRRFCSQRCRVRYNQRKSRGQEPADRVRASQV